MVTKAKALANVRSKVNHEPVIDAINYKVSLMLAMNWYNQNNTSSDYKAWFVSHFKKRIDFPTNLVHDQEYRTAGVLIRIRDNGNIISDIHATKIETEYVRIRNAAMHAKRFVIVDDTPAVTVKKGPSIQERMIEKVQEFMGEFNGMIDAFMKDGTVPNISALIKTVGIAGQMGKKVVEKIERPMSELREVLEGADKQLLEGWSNYKKSDIKKMLAIYELLIEKLTQAKVTAPIKLRKVKIKPAGVIVQKLQYLKEHVELKLKSVSPASIIGASELWVFNTKYNKLQCYIAADGLSLSVKGTTLLNYNTEKAEQKTVRKPDTVQVLTSAGKRTYAQFQKALTGKISVPSGRINADCIILATFK